MDQAKFEAFAEGMTVGKAIKYILVVMVILVGLGIAGSYLGLIGKVATAPAKVLSKTLETDNIIQSYEWFYDIDAAYKSRFNQIKQYHGFLNDEANKEERTTLRTELAAMQQTCRDLAAKYNANSEKMNKKIFKGWELPGNLSIARCDQPVRSKS